MGQYVFVRVRWTRISTLIYREFGLPYYVRDHVLK